MAMTEADYRYSLQGLLPPGPAFDPGLQPEVDQLLAGLAPELARVDGALDALQLELNPATVVGLLTDWETFLGLPDACTVAGSQTPAQRRAAVLEKLSATGAPQRSYYERLALRAGVPIQIEEFRPPRAGYLKAGDFLYGAGWPWSWRAAAPLDAYGTAEAAVVACRLKAEAPEYTDVDLTYGREVVDRMDAAMDALSATVHYTAPASIAGLQDL